MDQQVPATWFGALPLWIRASGRPVTTWRGLADRYPFNSAWVRGLVSRWGLALWFALLVLPTINGFMSRSPLLFIDARLYLEATRAYLAGADPWAVSYAGILFAAPPPTLLPLVPFALLPDPMGWIVLGGLCIAGAVATLHLLDLPWWWLLFPPIVHGIVSGNVQLLLLPLMLRGLGWAAGYLKLYAIVPEVILGHWKQVAIFVALLVATAPLLPWSRYLARMGEINAVLADQSSFGLSTSGSLLFLVPALGAMWVVGRERSAWLVVPALWPSQQWYYATLVLPARSRVVAFVLAIPFAEAGLAALFALALATLLDRSRMKLPQEDEREIQPSAE